MSSRCFCYSVRHCAGTAFCRWDDDLRAIFAQVTRVVDFCAERSHSLEELKLHPRYKTRPCLDYFQTGKCHQGVEECGFYHSEEERREPAPEGPAKEHRPIVPERCTFLESRGACYKGANCKFCHSEEQLRTIHKTRPCDNYWLHGFCSRGSNCGFYHDPAERRRSASSAIRSSSSSSHSPALLRKESAKYVHSSAGTPAQPHQFQRQDSAYESYRVSNASLDPFPSYLCRRVPSCPFCPAFKLTPGP